MSDGGGQKTEQPSQRRLLKAREEGRFPSSKEFVGGAQFATFVALLLTFSMDWFSALRDMVRFFLMAAFRHELTPIQVSGYLSGLVFPHLSLLAGFGGTLVGIGVATQLAITQFGFATSKLAPDFARLNPMSRLKQLPRQNIPAFVQAAVMLPVFLFIVYALVSSRVDEFMSLPLGSVESGASRVASALSDLLVKAAAVFFILGCIDLFRKKRQHNQDLRMSKQELRDEHKESEGNPQIKMRIRRIQRDVHRRNMMKEIPTATAIIVNPTHYAVAIRYHMDSMAAPTVVAKGKNYLAQRIRQIALDHSVPIVENVPLAQALYKSAEVGQEIPAHLYRAVAEILAYIFRLMNGKLPGRG